MDNEQPEIVDYRSTLQEVFLIDRTLPIDHKAKRAALENLARLNTLRKVIDEAILDEVITARTNRSGSAYWSDAKSWDEVGQALGVSKQAVAKKFGAITSITVAMTENGANA